MDKSYLETLLIAKEDLENKHLYEMQKFLLKQRQIRMIVMSVLLLALIVTVIYGTLEDPIRYTLSNIGNFFTYRWFFILWATLTGLAIQVSIIALFKLENYQNKSKYFFVGLSVAFLILTAWIPAIKSVYPFWHIIHTIFAFFHALFLLLAILPFTTFVARANPRLRKIISVWEIIIWGGGVMSLLIIGHSAIFELWFFISMIVFLLYLSLVLFEEQIVKISVTFLKDESDINHAIDTIFINYDRELKNVKN